MEDRYERHRLMDWWDQNRLAEARVLVAGAGAIGNEVLKNLALLGVGNILIVDNDRVELTNLSRNVLFRESDIGMSKASVAAERVRNLNPYCNARHIVGDLEYDVGLGVYRAMDAAIGGLDSINARLALNRACLRAGVPWLNGGIDATIAEVSLFGPESGACFECGMSAMMWHRRNRRYACGGLRTEVSEAKVPTTATVASIVAGYIVNELMVLLHAETGKPKDGLAFGQKLFLMLKPYAFSISDLSCNPECTAHDVWNPIEIVEVQPQYISAGELLRQVGEPSGVLELGFDLLTAMRCQRCGGREEVFRPVETCDESLAICRACGTPTRLPDTISWLDIDSDYAELPLASLGITDYQILAIKSTTARRYVQLTGIYEI